MSGAAKVALVTTTIYVPELLDSYLADARASGWADLTTIVVGDRKTPPAAADFCAGLRRRHEYDVRFLGVAEQEAYLANYRRLARYLPWNSIQRRNVGMLMAYEEGADIVVTIDDDNFLAEPNFFAGHAAAGRPAELDAFGSTSGWVNVCATLEEARGFRFYPRGFPPGARAGGPELDPVVSRRAGRVVVNAGLWLEEPDVDAVTRLAVPMRVTGYRRRDNFTLARGTWSPFNSQNTALAADAIPAYFLSPTIGRYDDIWAGYVLLAIADHLDGLIAFGHPLVRQGRNPHDFWKDLDAERMGMRLTDRFCGYLRAIPFAERTYADCYEEAIEGLAAAIAADRSPDAAERDCLHEYVAGMKVWHGALSRAARERGDR